MWPALIMFWAVSRIAHHGSSCCRGAERYYCLPTNEKSTKLFHDKDPSLDASKHTRNWDFELIGRRKEVSKLDVDSTVTKPSVPVVVNKSVKSPSSKEGNKKKAGQPHGKFLPPPFLAQQVNGLAVSQAKIVEPTSPPEKNIHNWEFDLMGRREPSIQHIESAKDIALREDHITQLLPDNFINTDEEITALQIKEHERDVMVGPWSNLLRPKFNKY